LKKGFFTIFVLPSDSSKARKYRISIRLFRAARVSLVVLFLLGSYLVVDYSSVRFKISELNRFRQENTSQKIELQSFSARINELEDRLSRLNVFDKKLRIMANLEDPASSKGGLMGMGGAPPDEDYFLSTGDKKGELVKRMHSDLASLEVEANFQERSFTELQEFFLKQSSILSSTPSIWPARGWLTSAYGKRRDPFTGRLQSHNGLDIANRVGTAVVAPSNGMVTKVTMNAYLGKVLEIRHGYGIKTLYGHLSEVYVKVGQKVKRGDRIAAMGNTGRSTGPHVHYEVTVNGASVSPSRYILN